MSHLLTMSELSEVEISEILKDAEYFANGKESKTTEQTFVANLFLRIVRERDLALKLLRRD